MKRTIRQLNFEDERNSFQEELNRIEKFKKPVALLLDNVTDAKNIGGLFRLADAANIEKIYFYKCDFDPKHKQVQRTSRSTIKYIPYQQINEYAALERLKETYEMVGLEITNESISYQDYQAQKLTLNTDSQMTN